MFANRVVSSNKRMKLIGDHLQYKLGTSLHNIFFDQLSKAFYPTVPLIAHFQMMFLFVKEGMNTFHNIGYSLIDKLQVLFQLDFKIKKYLLKFQIKQQQILDCQLSDEINLIIQATPPDLISNIKMLRQFFKFGFKNKLKKCSVQKLKISSLKTQKGKQNFYYRPKQREQSYILQYMHFELIWSWLPHFHKLQDPIQIYSTQVDGYSLQQIYLKSIEFKNMPMLLIIKTQNNIFGAYCDRMLNLKNNKIYYGSNECFVFQIEPNPRPYYSTKINENHLFVDNTYFTIGSDSVALSVNSDLQGKTFKSETYNNLPLNGADPEDYNGCSFDILELELYTIYSL